jgi:hypothetical protein
VRPILVLAMVLAAALPARAEHREVAILIAGPADEPVAAQLGEVLPEPPTRRTAGGIESDRALIEAAAAFPEPFVIALDVGHGIVRVLRVEDATVVSRAFDPAAAGTAPYAVALAVAELLELAREAPRASPDLPAPAAARGRTPAPAALRLRVAILGGGSFSAAVDESTSWLAPAIAAQALVGRGHDPWWFGAGVTGAPIAQFSREVVDQGFVVHYRRSEIGAQLIAARRVRSTTLLLSIDGIAAWVRAVAESPTATLPDHRRITLGLGPGVALRLDLGAGISLQVGATGIYTPGPARYLVRRSVVISEGFFQVRGGVMLGWESP